MNFDFKDLMTFCMFSFFYILDILVRILMAFQILNQFQIDISHYRQYDRAEQGCHQAASGKWAVNDSKD